MTDIATLQSELTAAIEAAESPEALEHPVRIDRHEQARTNPRGKGGEHVSLSGPAELVFSGVIAV